MARGVPRWKCICVSDVQDFYCWDTVFNAFYATMDSGQEWELGFFCSFVASRIFNQVFYCTQASWLILWIWVF